MYFETAAHVMIKILHQQKFRCASPLLMSFFCETNECFNLYTLYPYVLVRKRTVEQAGSWSKVEAIKPGTAELDITVVLFRP